LNFNSFFYLQLGRKDLGPEPPRNLFVLFGLSP